MLLFNRHGYRETSMEDIAAEVGMPASGIYRYFAGKADMLAASFHRAADRVSGDLANVIAAESDPDQAIRRLISSYVTRSFDDPELAYVYYTERVNLPADDQVILRGIQRSTVESWVRLLIAVRPELTAGRRGSPCTRVSRSSSTWAGWCSTTTPRNRGPACAG